MKSRRSALWPLCLLLAVLVGCQAKTPVTPPPEVPDISHIEDELRRLAEAPLIPLEPLQRPASDEESDASPIHEIAAEPPTHVDSALDDQPPALASGLSPTDFDPQSNAAQSSASEPISPPWAKDLPSIVQRTSESAARRFEAAQREQRLRLLADRQRLFELRSQQWLESAAEQHVSHHELAYRLRLIAHLRTSLSDQFATASGP